MRHCDASHEVKNGPLVLFLLLLLLASPAAAQQRLNTFTPALRPEFALQAQQRSTSRLASFGLLGGGLGLVAGGLLGAVVGGNDSDDPDEAWVNALQGSVIGATIGESIGLGSGVHLANDRRGNFVLGTVASLAIGAAGAALVFENQDPPAAPIILAATPIAQLIATIMIERRAR